MVKISGTSVLHAAPERVWQAITDPAVLAGVIPGCQVLTPLGPDHFGLTVTMGVAAIKGTYAGEVRLYDMTQPATLTMRAAGAGAPGTIDTTVSVTLADAGDGTTRLDYDADAVVGGMVGGVGQRVLTSVAKKTAGLFFAAIDDVLTGKRPVSAPAGGAHPPVPSADGMPAGGAAVQGAAAEGAATGGAPVPFGATLSGAPAAAPAAGPATLVAAVLAGAVAMAVGVLIGARIGRRSG